jgi:hypothetical protein
MRRRKRLRAKLQINILNSLLNPFYILEESSLLSSRIFHLPPPPPHRRSLRRREVFILICFRLPARNLENKYNLSRGLDVNTSGEMLRESGNSHDEKLIQIFKRIKFKTKD